MLSLDIRPEIVGFPIRYDATSPMRQLGFWRGALATREQVMAQAENDYEKSTQGAAIARIEAIMESLDAGHAVEQLPDYQRWLAYER